MKVDNLHPAVQSARNMGALCAAIGISTNGVTLSSLMLAATEKIVDLEKNLEHTEAVLSKDVRDLTAIKFTNEQQIAALEKDALDGLFSNTFFNICAVDSILEMCKVPRESDAYKMLKTLHCKHYDAMSIELRERLPLIVRDALMPQRCEATDIVMNGLVIEQVKP